MKYFCSEIVGNIPNEAIDIPEGSDVRALMKIAAERYGSFAENYLDLTGYMVNMKGAGPDTILHDGDSVMVLRITYGG